MSQIKHKRPKIILGLGNPGVNYLQHRHNVGFWFLDEIINRHQLSKKERPNYMVYPWVHEYGTTYLIRSKLYMNDTGLALSEAKNFYKVETDEVCVAYDDMDFTPGELRVKKAGGAGGHNGIKSLQSHIGDAFYRLRFGIGRPDLADAVRSYVLTRPPAPDALVIQGAVALAVDYIDLLLKGRYDMFTETLHTMTRRD
ncbi:aminoacyl-tRNA hydrolase [Gammaproteobacteria bacterium]|nr:aminoacyl-tRNA hydrolase [Gammaproteobacteria bacterium]